MCDECTIRQSISDNLSQAAIALGPILDMAQPLDYPWRDAHDPFYILIAEMMLVRTRADLVVGPYSELIGKYPTVADLALAVPSDLTPILAPLGLLKRIPLFVRAAQYILDQFGGVIPNERKALKSIPGMGSYTADAVLAFAFDQPIVPTDVNVLRWAARVSGLPMVHRSKGSAEVRQLLDRLSDLGGRRAYRLLDFLRATCRPRRPLCGRCAIMEHCSFGRKRQNYEPKGLLQP